MGAKTGGGTGGRPNGAAGRARRLERSVDRRPRTRTFGIRQNLENAGSPPSRDRVLETPQAAAFGTINRSFAADRAAVRKHWRLFSRKAGVGGGFGRNGL